MKVIDPGHVYELDHLDGDAKQRLSFVNRGVRGQDRCEGTYNQEVLRAQIDCCNVLIDRVNHCDEERPWEGNLRIIKSITEAQRQMRLALLLHEQRAMERKMERGELRPEHVPVGDDGHFEMAAEAKAAAAPIKLAGIASGWPKDGGTIA